MIYVAGFIWAEIKQLYQEGFTSIYGKKNFLIIILIIYILILGGYMEFIRLGY